MSTLAIQVIARGPRRDAEAAAAAIDADVELENATYSIIEEDEDRGVWRIDAFPTSPGEDAGLVAKLGDFPALQVTREAIADADWLAMALSGLPPVRAGRFFVFGVHDAGRVPGGVTPLRIEAGAAFGTGHHGTTVGCLKAFSDLRKERTFPCVLDVGAGTGLLAIAAAKTGSRDVLGVDLDPISVRIANENARVNAVRARFVYGDGLAHPEVRTRAPYDLIFANILAAPLVRLSTPIARALAPRGRVILSGLLHSQSRRVLAAYRSRGLILERRIRRDAWATLVLRRA